MNLRSWLSLVVFVAGISLINSNSCHAHFLWVKSITLEGQPAGLLYFGESPADEAYHFPEKLASVKLWARSADGKLVEVALKPIDTEERNGLIGLLGKQAAVTFETNQQYGVYGTSLLEYHSKHVCGRTAEAINAAGHSKELRLEIVPQIKGKQVVATVLWGGKPLPKADITIYLKGEEPAYERTDGDGRVTFNVEGGGFVGLLTNTIEKDVSGEHGGKKYTGAAHYASLTFELSKGATGDAPKQGSQAEERHEGGAAHSPVAELPEPIASFGAVVCGDYLYVYGGHTGEEHAHSAANLSQHFWRIRLAAGSDWEELPMQMPLQGFPLISHGGKVYRVGGLNIRNATVDDPEDLHSTAEFAEYDPATSQWRSLEPLPAARSSHNGVVMGDKLYVVGGWRLTGSSPGDWEQDALVYDFSNPQAGWEKLPTPPFQRRALGIATWNGKVVALGGMTSKEEVSMQVDLYDPQSGEWSRGPKMPGAGMAGFGVSAWNSDGRLYECGFRGKLNRLNGDGTAWEEVGRLQTPRFFHQLVPAPRHGLMVVGGACYDGHLASIERVELAEPTAQK